MQHVVLFQQCQSDTFFRCGERWRSEKFCWSISRWALKMYTEWPTIICFKWSAHFLMIIRTSGNEMCFITYLSCHNYHSSNAKMHRYCLTLQFPNTYLDLGWDCYKFLQGGGWSGWKLLQCHGHPGSRPWWSRGFPAGSGKPIAHSTGLPNAVKCPNFHSEAYFGLHIKIKNVLLSANWGFSLHLGDPQMGLQAFLTL